MNRTITSDCAVLTYGCNLVHVCIHVQCYAFCGDWYILAPCIVAGVRNSKVAHFI
jgi:hypothetical protein